MDGSYDTKCPNNWIEIPRTIDEKHDTLRSWCHKHLAGGYVINIWNIQFEHENDLVLFRLRFG